MAIKTGRPIIKVSLTCHTSGAQQHGISKLCNVLQKRWNLATYTPATASASDVGLTKITGLRKLAAIVRKIHNRSNKWSLSLSPNSAITICC